MRRDEPRPRLFARQEAMVHDLSLIDRDWLQGRRVVVEQRHVVVAAAQYDRDLADVLEFRRRDRPADLLPHLAKSRLTGLFVRLDPAARSVHFGR